MSNEKQADKTIFRTTQRTDRILKKLCVNKRSIQPFFAYHDMREEGEEGHPSELPSTTRSNNSSASSDDFATRSRHSKSRSSSQPDTPYENLALRQISHLQRQLRQEQREQEEFKDQLGALEIIGEGEEQIIRSI